MSRYISDHLCLRDREAPSAQYRPKNGVQKAAHKPAEQEGERRRQRPKEFPRAVLVDRHRFMRLLLPRSRASRDTLRDIADCSSYVGSLLLDLRKIILGAFNAADEVDVSQGVNKGVW